MKITFKNTEEEAYYQQIADYLENKSEDICKDNHCTEDEYFCESYAYFDYDKIADQNKYSLADVCCSDYAQKCYASYVILPFTGNAFDLLEQLEDSLLEEYWN
jgi:hypothetical protein